MENLVIRKKDLSTVSKSLAFLNAYPVLMTEKITAPDWINITARMTVRYRSTRPTKNILNYTLLSLPTNYLLGSFEVRGRSSPFLTPIRPAKLLSEQRTLDILKLYSLFQKPNRLTWTLPQDLLEQQP